MKISTSFSIHGTSQLITQQNRVTRNGVQQVWLHHHKPYPDDPNSYIQLHSIQLNDVWFEEPALRHGTFFPNQELHPDAPHSIQPCLEFGYVGSFCFPVIDDLELWAFLLNNNITDDQTTKQFDLFRKI